LIEEKLIPPWDQKEKGGRITQGWSLINNVDEDVDISKVGESDMPFWENLQVKEIRLIRAHIKTIIGQPSWQLGL
jgi:hypothetical protein